MPSFEVPGADALLQNCIRRELRVFKLLNFKCFLTNSNCVLFYVPASIRCDRSQFFFKNGDRIFVIDLELRSQICSPDFRHIFVTACDAV
jgi:hypothetical protein